MSRSFRARSYPNAFTAPVPANPDMTMHAPAIPAPGSGSFTVEGWVYFPAASTNGGLLSVVAADGASGLGIWGVGGDLECLIGGATGPIVPGYFTGRSGWRHLVLSADSTSHVVTLYENGVSVGTLSPGAWSMPSTLSFFAGTVLLISFAMAGMRACGCRAYSRALSLAEAQDRYYDARSDASMNTGLLGEWLFAEGSGTSVADASGHGRGLTLASASDWVAGGPTFSGKPAPGSNVGMGVGLSLVGQRVLFKRSN